jgi:hypothetical protein
VGTIVTRSLAAVAVAVLLAASTGFSLSEPVGDPEPLREEPVAVVVRSQAPVQAPSQAPAQAAAHTPAPEEEGIPALGALLHPGDRLAVPEGGRVVLLHLDGEVAQVEGALEVPEVEGPSDPIFRILRALLRPSEENAGEASPPEGAGEHGIETVSAEPVRPVGDRWVRSLTPALTWRADGEAREYRVHIWGPDGGVWSLPAGEDTTWTIPTESALAPGAGYEWAVESLPGQRVGPRATFRVASRDVLDGLAQALGRLRSMGLDPEEDGRLAAAALFRSMALPYDALDALSRLQETDQPWSPALEAFHRRLIRDLGRANGAPDTEGIRDESPDEDRGRLPHSRTNTALHPPLP